MWMLWVGARARKRRWKLLGYKIYPSEEGARRVPMLDNALGTVFHLHLFYLGVAHEISFVKRFC